ncbi:MAG: nucleotide exchange factor GrpE [bacterium]|nr:nucleotide exchange factor GrpE [bacterium]
MHALKLKREQFVIDEPKEPVISEDQNSLTQPKSYGDLVEEISALLRQQQSKQNNQFQPSVSQATVDPIIGLVEDLIPILDSFERTLDLAKSFSDNEVLSNWMKNIEAIYRKLKLILFRLGLREIESIGQPIDYNKHEVVEYQETNEVPENTIIAEKQRGYSFRDKVIRDAKVVVAKRIAHS